MVPKMEEMKDLGKNRHRAFHWRVETAFCIRFPLQTQAECEVETKGTCRQTGLVFGDGEILFLRHFWNLSSHPFSAEITHFRKAAGTGVMWKCSRSNVWWTLNHHHTPSGQWDRHRAEPGCEFQVDQRHNISFSQREQEGWKRNYFREGVQPPWFEKLPDATNIRRLEACSAEMWRGWVEIGSLMSVPISME